MLTELEKKAVYDACEYLACGYHTYSCTALRAAARATCLKGIALATRYAQFYDRDWFNHWDLDCPDPEVRILLLLLFAEVGGVEGL